MDFLVAMYGAKRWLRRLIGARCGGWEGDEEGNLGSEMGESWRNGVLTFQALHRHVQTCDSGFGGLANANGP